MASLTRVLELGRQPYPHFFTGYEQLNTQKKNNNNNKEYKVHSKTM